MKYISFAIPSYNSEDYISRAIESILPGGEDVEIIIVNDGSKDGTLKIAKEYKEKYPDIIKVVDKENGGHGDAVNFGLANATGKYFKVVDSDDWVNEEALLLILSFLKELERDDKEIDMLVSNYVYEKVGAAHKKCIHYRNVLPQDKIFTWDEIGRFHLDQYILMHSVIYRTSMIKLSQMTLPKHTFYVDNLFAYCPLPYVQTIYYMHNNLYQYYLGRDDQSVNEKVLMSRIEQQIQVTKMVAESVDLQEVRRRHPKLAGYMCRNVSIMMAISSIHLLLKGDEQANNRHFELWAELKKSNPRLYYRLRYTKLSGFTNLPGKLGKLATVGGYRLARKIYQFQ